MITREKLKKLNKENLIELILEMSELLTENQNRKYNQIVAGYLTDQSVNSHDGVQARMSDEFVSEKMAQIKIWIQQIDEGELYLNADEYEDYSSGYWDSDRSCRFRGVGRKRNSDCRPKAAGTFDPVCGLSSERAGRTGGRYIFIFFTLCIS